VNRGAHELTCDGFVLFELVRRLITGDPRRVRPRSPQSNGSPDGRIIR
jgi:hypothetical protein